MTKLERKKPDVLNASRKRRIAAGAGVEVTEVNRLLKQHRQMADVFKFMSRDGGQGLARMAGMHGRRRHGPAGADMARLKAPRRRADCRRPRTRTEAGGRPARPRRRPHPGRRPGPGGGGFNPFKKP